MLVYDITDKKSFESIEDWLEIVKRNCPPNVTMMLIGNKSDLEEERKVSIEMAQAYADQHKMIFMETSAKDRVNIDESFFSLAKNVLPKIARA